MNKDISLPKVSVLDSEMAYREAGSRDAPVALFLHGNPTSSYIWRNIIPIVAPVAHCIAPDLIGFGQSSKPDIAYRFEDHVRYLVAFIAKMGIGSAYLVVQDWGSGLAFHLAQRRPDFVRGLSSGAKCNPRRHGRGSIFLLAEPSLSPGNRAEGPRSEWETRLSVEEPMLSTGLHFASESTRPRLHGVHSSVPDLGGVFARL
jgi:pimeloyl-ACP methyl ester carboxylesterase